jgi:hypothetical protein
MKASKLLLATFFVAFLGGSVLAADGRIESLGLLDKIKVGVATAQQVRDLLGPPMNTMRFPARGIETLEYEGRGDFGRILISISVDSDGVVRDILQRRPPSF